MKPETFPEGTMETKELRLFYHPPERLRLTVAHERSYITVRPVWAAPLSRPGHYLSLVDEKGDEIVLLEEPEKALDEASWTAVREELRRRYLTSLIRTIRHAKSEYGATYWEVETDRGPRDFVTQSLQDNALWFSDTHLLLLDVDGNRFEIPNAHHLDDRSRKLLQAIL